MRWYQPIRLASKPPAYVLERVSDLLKASTICNKSPSNAKSILQRVIGQLEEHMDQEYLEDLQRASGIVLDSPQRAKSLIEIVVGRMKSDKKYKEKPWVRNWLR